MAGPNRRQHARISLGLPVIVDAAPQGEFAAELVDISKGGLFLSSDVEVLERDQVRVTFLVLPDRSCDGTGRVVRTAEGGFAVEFANCNPDLESFVQDLTNLSPELHTDFLSAVLKPHIRIVSADSHEFDIDVELD